MSHSEQDKMVRVLRKARALIEDKKRWTRGEYARDRWSHHVDPDDVRAVRWCALGALDRQIAAGSRVHMHLYMTALELYRSESVSEINDDMGHKYVLKLYDRAIALAEQGE